MSLPLSPSWMQMYSRPKAVTELSNVPGMLWKMVDEFRGKTKGFETCIRPSAVKNKFNGLAFGWMYALLYVTPTAPNAVGRSFSRAGRVYTLPGTNATSWQSGERPSGRV